MIRLPNVLKMSSRRICETFWRRLGKTSWRSLEDVIADVLKTSWRRMDKTNILVLTKTSSEDIWLRRIYSSSSKRLSKTKTKDVCKTSSSRRMCAGYLLSISSLSWGISARRNSPWNYIQMCPSNVSLRERGLSLMNIWWFKKFSEHPTARCSNAITKHE